MNYDFKSNWEKKIMPLLNTKRIKNAVRKGIKSYLDEAVLKKNWEIKYDENKLPYEYYYHGDSLFEEEMEEIEEKLIKIGILNPPKEENYEKDEDYNEALQDYFDEMPDIVDPYLQEVIKKSYKSYCLYGACFWYNTTFGLRLARMLMPRIKWVVKSSNIHATVISKDEKLVFDILYYDEDDETFGGKKALEDSNSTISWEEHDKKLNKKN
jgi:hypothetical protein